MGVFSCRMDHHGDWRCRLVPCAGRYALNFLFALNSPRAYKSAPRREGLRRIKTGRSRIRGEAITNKSEKRVVSVGFRRIGNCLARCGKLNAKGIKNGKWNLSELRSNHQRQYGIQVQRLRQSILQPLSGKRRNQSGSSDLRGNRIVYLYQAEVSGLWVGQCKVHLITRAVSDMGCR